MTTALDLERLEIEINSIEELVLRLGTGRRYANERASLVERSEALLQELDVARGAKHRSVRAAATVLFGGVPVLGDREIDVSFAIDSLRRYQKLVGTIYAAQLQPTVALHESGSVPGGTQTRLTITGLAHGCFGFAVAERVGALYGTGVGLADAMESASVLLDSAATDDEAFAEAVAAADDRVLREVREFYAAMQRSGATMKLSTAKRVVELNKSRVDRGRHRTQHTTYFEDQIKVSGVCAAIADNGATKIHRIDGDTRETLSCKTDEQTLPLVMARLGLLFRRACIADITRFTVQTVGKVKRSYQLGQIAPSPIDSIYSKLDDLSRAHDTEREGDDRPNPTSLDAARAIISTFWMIGLQASAAKVDADGGVGVYAGDFPRRYVVVLCDNDGGIGAVATERAAEDPAWTWDFEGADFDASILALAKRSKDWLGGSP